MSEITAELERIYGNRVRVRVCGICIQDDQLLLINHSHLGARGSLWAPPGGGLNFGESTQTTLIREYQEETGLEIVVEDFLFMNEYLYPPLHSIELFFLVKPTGGILTKGADPEMSSQNQIIKEVRYWRFEDIIQEDPLLFHSILRGHSTLPDFLSRRGFFQSA
jgi:8-oxo-dGTP diphosphatase